MEKQQAIINVWKCSRCGDSAIVKTKKNYYCSPCSQLFHKTKSKAIPQEEQTQNVSRLEILQKLNLTEEELHLLSSK